MNKTFAGVLAGTSIASAGVIGLAFVVALLLGQVELNWNGAWVVMRVILLLGLQVFIFRYFLARAR